VATDPRGMRLAIDTAGETTLVVPVGLPTVATGRMLRAKLLACLADQPAAVVVDLGMMWAQAPHLLSAFGSVARASARWSGVPLLLVSDPATGQRLWLNTMALSRLVGVYPTHALALAAIDSPAPRTLFESVVASAPDSARIAPVGRRHGCLLGVRAGRGRCGAGRGRAGGQCDYSWSWPVVLRMELRHRLLTQRLLTVSVCDDSPAWPVLRYAYDRSVGHGPGLGGQGLRLVEALTRRWGWTPTTGGGKVV
jgi:hypothetical protein